MYRDILVHLDGTARSMARLELAAGLATRQDGRLTGVFARVDPDKRAIIARRPSDRLSEIMAEAEAAFRQACAGTAVQADWMPMPFGGPDFIIREMAICSRFFDLAVLGQIEEDQAILPAELNEEIIRQSGGPVLTVPFAGAFEGVGQCVLIAWNGSREAARAVRDAMPVLAKAAEVRVLGLHLRTVQEAGLPQVNIIERLRRSGIKATYDVIPPGEIGTMDMVLSCAADAGADLIVMGAFGDEGIPGLGRGAGTRHMLQHMTVPLLMSH